MVSKTIPVKSFDLVIFGATGDLSKRKIIPALFRRFIAGQVPTTSRIIGVSRRDLSQSDFKIFVRNSISAFAPNVIFTENQINGFCKMLNFISMDLVSDKGWDVLAEFFMKSSQEIRTFYLSISPALIEPCTERLNSFELITPQTRVVVEKPLGTDLASATMLNKTLCSVFKEKQIFRIDH